MKIQQGNMSNHKLHKKQNQLHIYCDSDLYFHCPQADTSLQCETTNTGLAHRVVCLLTPQLLLALTASTHEGMARLS